MSKTYLITGGAGFIGSNLAAHYLAAGGRVNVVDSFTRPGAQYNAAWLKNAYPDRAQIVNIDVRHPSKRLDELVEASQVVFHLAGQVAVTKSVSNPREDFESNVSGTFNLLESVRSSSSRPVFVYSSTNKVYGSLEGLRVEARDGRSGFADLPHGIPETHPLEFRSPYGCSKGAGDQYVLDYAKTYGLKTLVFRQSCIYGPHQLGLEDQGWVAWFAIRALQGLPVTIYGDGRQVRDVLFIQDLIGAYDMALGAVDRIAGSVYNIGGGPGNAISLLEYVEMLEQQFGLPLERSFEKRRTGDQQVYISDIRKAASDFGWRPQAGVKEGVGQLIRWLRENRDFLSPGEAAAGLAAGEPARRHGQ